MKRLFLSLLLAACNQGEKNSQPVDENPGTGGDGCGYCRWEDNGGSCRLCEDLALSQLGNHPECCGCDSIPGALDIPWHCDADSFGDGTADDGGTTVVIGATGGAGDTGCDGTAVYECRGWAIGLYHHATTAPQAGSARRWHNVLTAGQGEDAFKCFTWNAPVLSCAGDVPSPVNLEDAAEACEQACRDLDPGEAGWPGFPSFGKFAGLYQWTLDTTTPLYCKFGTAAVGNTVPTDYAGTGGSGSAFPTCDPVNTLNSNVKLIEEDGAWCDGIDYPYCPGDAPATDGGAVSDICDGWDPDYWIGFTEDTSAPYNDHKARIDDDFWQELKDHPNLLEACDGTWFDFANGAIRGVSAGGVADLLGIASGDNSFRIADTSTGSGKSVTGDPMGTWAFYENDAQFWIRRQRNGVWHRIQVDIQDCGANPCANP